MLKFEPFSISALQKVLPYLKSSPSLCSDLSAGYLFMWYAGTDMQFCVWNDTFVVRQTIGKQPAFSYPIGDDPNAMIDALIAYAYDNRLPLRFFAVDEATLDKIRGDNRLQPALSAYDRRWSDYIYSFEEAMTFKGKKYSGQRNHINKFKKLYGEPEIRLLTDDDRPAVAALLSEYEAEHADGGALERKELAQTKKLFETYSDLGLYAAGLFVEGKMAAFSIGEVVGDMLVIHVEKALRRYEGVYPTMYSGFVRLIADCLGQPLKFVNREDDSGDPGLRTSKMQYHPICMAHKYLVHMDAPAMYTEPVFSFSTNDVVLTDLQNARRMEVCRS